MSTSRGPDQRRWLNMVTRQFLRSHLAENDNVFTMTWFPRLGARDGKEITFDRLANGVQRSQYVKDELLSPYERYQKLSSNLRESRGERIALNVPIFRDRNNPWPFQDPTVRCDLNDWPEDENMGPSTVKTNHVYADALSFGGYNCASQATVQTKNPSKAQRLHDQLIPMGPIMLGLTAATPSLKGYLVDTDTRWRTILELLDDSGPGEHDIKPRYTSNLTYMAAD